MYLRKSQFLVAAWSLILTVLDVTTQKVHLGQKTGVILVWCFRLQCFSMVAGRLQNRKQINWMAMREGYSHAKK